MKQLLNYIFDPAELRGQRGKQAAYYALLIITAYGLVSIFYGLYNLLGGFTSGNNIPWI